MEIKIVAINGRNNWWETVILELPDGKQLSAKPGESIIIDNFPESPPSGVATKSSGSWGFRSRWY